MYKKVVAFTYKAAVNDSEIAKKCLNLLETNFDLLNIPQYNISDWIQKDAIVISFGSMVEKLVKQHLIEKNIDNTKLILLPSLKQLRSQEDNREHRSKAFQQLQDLKELLKTDLIQNEELIFTEEDLPDFDHKHLIMLEKIKEKSGKNNCFLTSKNGKLISVGDLEQENKADIKITFEELYTLRLTMDVLGVNEVQLVKNNSNDSDRNN